MVKEEGAGLMTAFLYVWDNAGLSSVPRKASLMGSGKSAIFDYWAR